MIQSLAQASSLFTAPIIAGAAALALSIPIAIHLLWRIRREQQVWAAMRFLQVAIQKQKNKLRLEHWFLLLVRGLILLLLGLGLAGPVGAGLSRLLGMHASHRLVHLIIDDTLTSQTQQALGANHSRLEDLKETALKVLAMMDKEDHLAIWRSAGPYQYLQSPSLLNLAQARQLIDSIQSRHASSDLPQVLTVIQTQLDDALYLEFEQVVVILSDFSQGSIGRQIGQSFDRLTRDATVMLASPQLSVPNVQIVRLEPRRSQLLRPLNGPLAVMLDVSLRREGRIDQAASTTIQLLESGQEVAMREHQWAPGQSQATLQMDMTYHDQSASYPILLPIEARIAVSRDLDRLAADNHRWAQVQIRDQLRILLVDEDRLGDLSEQGFSASDWLAFALAPNQNNFSIQRITPWQLNAQVISDADVCMVLRPDRLSEQQFVDVDQWTQGGGLLWVFAPAKGGLSTWASSLAQQMHLPIRRDIQTLTGQWGLTLANRPPSAMSLLGADWQALLRPVRVSQTLSLFNTQDIDASGEVWLRLGDQPQTPLLVSQQVGDGYMLLCSLALSPTWSNLQTRPLFVPLLHEAIQSLSSQSTQKRLNSTTPAPGTPGTGTSGSMGSSASGLLLGSGFAGATQLIGPKRLMLQVTDTGMLTPTQPMDVPGVYRADKDGSRNLLLVNLDPASSSLQTTDTAAVRQLFFDQSQESLLHWIDSKNLSWPTADTVSSSQLGRTLIWIVLLLLVLETMLARWFSHAKTQSQSLGTWLIHGLVKLRHLDHPTRRPSGKGVSR
ncbi:MAG: BatA domain-containing protein [Phycisphaeraceae bacterium]|nr:BatA domain-containing protein [Phycisphaeraceae bacterium]